MKLYRYNNGWQALTTTLVRIASDVVVYKATTPGFSDFGISGQVKSEEQPVQQPTQQPEQQPAQQTTQQEQTTSSGSSASDERTQPTGAFDLLAAENDYVISIVVIVVIFIALLIFVRLSRRRNKTSTIYINNVKIRKKRR